jgi:UDP-glucose 4-epimerase
MSKKILVAGGAGYIGSITVCELIKAGYKVTVFDSLVHGHRQSINTSFIKGDLLDKESIKRVFKKEKFAGVIHFASYIEAGESMINPAKYLENNLQGGLNLLEAMKENYVTRIVFSSTAAVYGYPKKFPVAESAEKIPVNLYGETKLMFEKILEWYDRLFGIKNVCLRYFNASGALLDGSLGENHNPESHVIPIAFQVILGQREKFIINGEDYKTKDGTCVRDYIHVLDLVDAHLKALNYLFKGNPSDFLNVGTGKGYSVKEIVKMVEKVTGSKLKIEIGPRRKGDPDTLIADNKKIKRILGWKPKYSDLQTIIKTAWVWHKKHPRGFDQKN